MTNEFPGTMTGTETLAMIQRADTRFAEYRRRARAMCPVLRTPERLDEIAVELAWRDYLQLVEPLVKMKLRLAATGPVLYVLHPDGRLEAQDRPEYVPMVDEIDRQIAEIAKQFQL